MVLPEDQVSCCLQAGTVMGSSGSYRQLRIRLTLCWLTYQGSWCTGGFCLHTSLLAPAAHPCPSPLQTSPVIMRRNHMGQRNRAKMAVHPSPFLFLQIHFPSSVTIT